VVRKFCSVQLHNLYSPLNVLRVTKIKEGETCRGRRKLRRCTRSIKVHYTRSRVRHPVVARVIKLQDKNLVRNNWQMCLFSVLFDHITTYFGLYMLPSSGDFRDKIFNKKSLLVTTYPLSRMSYNTNTTESYHNVSHTEKIPTVLSLIFTLIILAILLFSNFKIRPRQLCLLYANRLNGSVVTSSDLYF
jgi:hypothetical protein